MSPPTDLTSNKSNFWHEKYWSVRRIKNLFGSDGVFALDAFCMANTLFAFDYDDKLAPIVNDPRSAVMRPETSLLIRKVQDLAPVALISGSARADVTNFLTVPIDYSSGNHGLEGLPGGVSSLEQAGISCEKWHDALRGEHKADGVVIEDKNYGLVYITAWHTTKVR